MSSLQAGLRRLVTGSESRSTTVNQYPAVHHPLDACYDSVLDEPQLGFGLPLVTHSIRSRSHICGQIGRKIGDY
jgi:hypothetical protein